MMEELKHKRNQMFKSEGSSATAEDSGEENAGKMISIPKSQLNTLQITPLATPPPPGKETPRKPGQVTSSLNASQLPDGGKFNSKILTRSQSSSQKMTLKTTAPAVIALTTVTEAADDSETSSVMKYWKNKTSQPTTPGKVVKKPVKSTVSFVNSLPSSPEVSSSPPIPLEKSNAIDVPITSEETTSEQRSASDLIKSFNTNATKKKVSVNNSNVYMNRGKNTKAKAPAAPKQSSVAVVSLATTTTQPQPKPVSTMVPVTNISRTPRLVKTQVSPRSYIIPPPPPLPQTDLDEVLPHLSSHSNFSSDEIRYSPISISVNCQSSNKINPSSSVGSSAQNATVIRSQPIQIVTAHPSDVVSFEDISPSDLVFPSPPSPVPFSSDIPKGVPPPPSSTVSHAVPVSA